MHPVIEAGLAIMRDPLQAQAFEQTANIDGSRCAMGCIRQAAVNAGIGAFVPFANDEDGEGDGSMYHEIPTEQVPAWEEVAGELNTVAPTWLIVVRNDEDRASLAEIADYISEAYAHYEEVGNA